MPCVICPAELEPLENFTTRRFDCPSVQTHVLIYYEDVEPAAAVADQDQASGESQSPGTTTKQASPYRILGGVIFEFFVPVNCGLITYLVVGKAARGKSTIK